MTPAFYGVLTGLMVGAWMEYKAERAERKSWCAVYFYDKTELDLCMEYGSKFVINKKE